MLARWRRTSPIQKHWCPRQFCHALLEPCSSGGASCCFRGNSFMTYMCAYVCVYVCMLLLPLQHLHDDVWLSLTCLGAHINDPQRCLWCVLDGLFMWCVRDGFIHFMCAWWFGHFVCASRRWHVMEHISIDMSWSTAALSWWRSVNLCMCMYVCMYACTHVCVYIYMYKCM